MKQIEAIISDADGTLVDTVDLILHGQHETAVTYLKNHGVPTDEIPSYATYETVLHQHVGGSTRQTFERTVSALYEDRAHHIEGVDYDELNSLLNPVQDRIAPEYVKAFPGLAETLTKIGSLGIKMAIFTSGSPHHIVRNFGIALKDEVGEYATLYKEEGIDDQTKLDMFTTRLEEVFHIPQFVVVTCEDVGDKTKPDPTSASMALERLGVLPENALVLGDHKYDILAGANAGIEQRVGITHGFDDTASLKDAGATRVIESLTELPGLLIN